MIDKNSETINLVRKIKGGIDVDECLYRLREQYFNMFVSIVDAFVKRGQFKITQQQREDFMSDCMLTIYNAAIKFDEDREVTFTTYLYRAIQFSLFRIWKTDIDLATHSHVQWEECEFKEDTSFDSKIDNKVDWDTLIFKAKEILSPKREWLFFNYHYIEGYNYTDIARMLHVSRPTVYKLNKTVLTKLREECNIENG